MLIGCVEGWEQEVSAKESIHLVPLVRWSLVDPGCHHLRLLVTKPLDAFCLIAYRKARVGRRKLVALP